MSSPRLLRAFLLVLLLGFFFGAFAIYDWDFSSLLSGAKTHPVKSAFLYVGILSASIFLLPLSSLPLLPLAAETWGIFIGGTLSALGWWFGALISFLIARHLGRPVLKLFVSLEKIDQWEKKFPKDWTFEGIVLLRLIFPTDLPSFALGLLKELHFSTYAFATLIGVLPFAYVWVGVGGALIKGDWFLVSLFGLTIFISVLILHRLWKKMTRARKP